jgi:hypothetical protein
MKASEIKEGGTYYNRGKGTTIRHVFAIGIEHRPKRWYSDSKPPDEPGVLFGDLKGRHEKLYLTSFAAWAGGEII